MAVGFWSLGDIWSRWLTLKAALSYWSSDTSKGRGGGGRGGWRSLCVWKGGGLIRADVIQIQSSQHNLNSMKSDEIWFDQIMRFKLTKSADKSRGSKKVQSNPTFWALMRSKWSLTCSCSRNEIADCNYSWGCFQTWKLWFAKKSLINFRAKNWWKGKIIWLLSETGNKSGSVFVPNQYISSITFCLPCHIQFG